MPMRCSVCLSPQREAIDAALTLGTASKRQIALAHGVSEHATARHLARHLPKRLARLAAKTEAAHDRTLAQVLETYTEDLLRIRDRAESKGDLKAAISAHRELARLAELQARSRGELRAPDSGAPAVHVHLGERALTAEDHAQALREARLLLEFEADEQRDREALVSPGEHLAP
jgi:hypothetical protein